MKKIINALKLIGLLAVLFFIGITACNKQEDINSNTVQITDDSFVINNNFDDLNKRTTTLHQPVLFGSSHFKVPIPNPNDCTGFTWYLVAEIDAPIYNGEPLSATDIRILGDKAYVSYHRQGDIYAGGIEVIDISDPGYPVIISYMEFEDIDINTLAIDDQGSEAERRIFLAGSSFKNGAVLRQVTTNNGYLSNSVIDVNLSKAYADERISASANGIALTNEYIYMTAGNAVGGTFQLNRQTLDFVSNEAYSDAKGIAVNGVNNGDYQISLVGGDDAFLNVYHIGTDRSLIRSIPLGSIVHQFVEEPYLGKAILTIGQGEKIAFVAMNSGGMKAVDIETGAVVYTSPASMLTTGNTHGLAVDGNLVYMANSDDGLFIGCIPEGGGEVTEIQHWDLDESGASANMVQTDGDWVFVAKGGGGLKILRKVANGDFPDVCDYDENGNPTCSEGPEDLCQNLFADFSLTLPEGRNALQNHPEYFLNGNREVVLTETADITVTFVSEVAGYRNSFGYYTYDIDNPPVSTNDIKGRMRIIFANASAVGSGGTLVEGDQVNLGTFEAGTVIGYFVISDGWNGYQVTEGFSTFYTIPEFNREGVQQAIMMFNESCGSLLTTFEDKHITSGDRDFNDLVVKTDISPMSAMNTVEVVHFPAGK